MLRSINNTAVAIYAGHTMDENNLLAGRIRDLSIKTYQNDYLTHTDFLSASDLALFYEILRKQGISGNTRTVNGVPFVVYGGRQDADRNVVCFLPSYQSEADFLRFEPETGSVIQLVHVLPRNRKFADVLTHRDYLGALMNLGIVRDKIGDILVGEEEAYIFVLNEIAELVSKELLQVKHTTVQCEIVNPVACTLEPKFEEVTGSVASERLDAVLAMVYHLSRTKAQELISAEQVFVGGQTMLSAGYLLKPGDRVSVRGHGKFIYTGAGPLTRKGRVFAKVRVYA